jgi:NAD(P)-dependent dehydrogenase (short-subunit alcohol dehydrogenase family)
MKSYADPKKKIIRVHGAAKGNIGEEIIEYLKSKGHGIAGAQTGTSPTSIVDTMVYCNGYTELEWIGDIKPDSLHHTMDSNFSSIVSSIEDFVAATKYNKEVRRIIIIGSMAHNNVLNGSSVYCATKAAINQYAKCAAYELAKYGYLVTVINPGNVLDTPMTTKVKEQLCILHDLNPHDAEDYWGKVNNLGEFITKKDIAKIVEFLLKPEARFLSGSSLDLRGSNR